MYLTLGMPDYALVYTRMRDAVLIRRSLNFESLAQSFWYLKEVLFLSTLNPKVFGSFNSKLMKTRRSSEPSEFEPLTRICISRWVRRWFRPTDFDFKLSRKHSRKFLELPVWSLVVWHILIRRFWIRLLDSKEILSKIREKPFEMLIFNIFHELMRFCVQG